MIRLRELCLGAILLATAAAGTHGQTTVINVPALPAWKAGHDGPTDSIQVGDTLGELLAARDAGDSGASHPTSRGYLLAVEGGRPVTISVTVSHGHPAVMIADGPTGTSLGNTDGSEDSDDGYGLPPGDPIAFAIGDGQTVALSVTPAHDGVWQVWVWGRRYPLEPLEPVEFTAEQMEPWLEMGYTEEQILAFTQQPDVMRAWRP